MQGLGRLLDALPWLDWEAVHRLADEVAPRAAAVGFERFTEATLDWLHTQTAAPGANAARLAPYALVWDKLRQGAREAEAFNLDKKPLILTTFADLAAAARQAQRAG